MTVPNVGDILMLSQVAWKAGRAFAAGREHAPIDFQAVEIDIAGLANALKLLAETLHAETGDSLISKSTQGTQDGVSIVLSSCQRTIHDLDSLLDRYQVIRKHHTVGGFAIERSWSDLILAQYNTVIWTTEGGSLHDLSQLLQTHTKSIFLLTEAVKSASLSQLERVVTPLAERFDSMYDLPGTLEDQLEEVSRFVQELALVNPPARAPPVPPRHPARSPTAEVSNPLDVNLATPQPPALSIRRTSVRTLPRQRSVSATSTTNYTSPFLAGALPPSSPQRMSDFDHKGASPPTPSRKRVSDFSFGGSSARDSASSYASSTSSAPLNSRHGLTSIMEPQLPPSPLNEPKRLNDSSSTLLPLPRPFSVHSTPDISQVKSTSALSPFPARQDSITKLHRSSTTASQKSAFEKDAFRNSAVLCDVRGTLVEYSQKVQPDPDCPSDMADIEMVPACDSCRIAVVRKRITSHETKSVRVVTSIWALSDDNNVRVELAMSDTAMYIPYSSYFSPAKISITVPCELKFHDVRYGNRLLKTTRTTWVNFVFSTIDGATLFQNEIMGRALLATFRTSKTLRVHDGALSTFAYAEQMCALETLRVWEDADSGAIIGLVHFAASFRDGYLAFYLNSSNFPIKVVDCGGREVKLKGLRVPIAEAGRAMRKDSVVDAYPEESAVDSAAGTERRGSTGVQKKGKGKDVDRKKVISGAKIEFASVDEKEEFLALVREYQLPGRLCELPDLLGVN